MTIDVNWLRSDKGYNPEVVRESERKRGRSGSQVDLCIDLDAKWRKANFDMDEIRKERNRIQKEIGMRKKKEKTDSCQDLVEKKESVEKEIRTQEQLAKSLQTSRDSNLLKIGNLVHESVPESRDEEDNLVMRTFGKIPQFFSKYSEPGFLPHFEILEKLGAVDLTRGKKVAGHRGYFLTGCGVLLNQALLNFALQFLVKKNYLPVQPPFLVKKEIMDETAELQDYDEVLYKVETTEEYLIATSEQPISAFHKKESLPRKELPKLYAGISTCFRKEAGSSGRDIKGIFRVHQFEKVEQFVICEPENSWKEHEKMIEVAEEFYRDLEIPYRVVNIVSGALNDAAAKKYDLEAWFPGDDEGKGRYRELVSCSNCLDYQSRRLQIRLASQGVDGVESHLNEFVHMLNSTLVASERALCCVVENYQEVNGIRVPEKLRPFMNTNFLEYVK